MPVVRRIDQQQVGIAKISVDDTDPIELPLESLLEHNLQIGQHLDYERWNTIQFEGRSRIAVQRALGFLAKRQRTVKALRTHLSANFTEEETEHAVNRVIELGYADDRAWARTYLTRQRSLGRSRSMLTRELRAEGISAEDLEIVLSSHNDRSTAVKAARKRSRSLTKLGADVRERRLYTYLQRRGFDPETINYATSIIDDENQRDYEPVT